MELPEPIPLLEQARRTTKIQLRRFYGNYVCQDVLQTSATMWTLPLKTPTIHRLSRPVAMDTNTLRFLAAVTFNRLSSSLDLRLNTFSGTLCIFSRHFNGLRWVLRKVRDYNNHRLKGIFLVKLRAYLFSE